LAAGTCKFPSFTRVSNGAGYVNVAATEAALQEAVATIGPVSVAIYAGDPSFSTYESGVYNGPCAEQIDHAVLVVGYGADASGNEYWIVKNSWATGWGMSGYINIARNQNNMCSIASYASYPVLPPLPSTTAAPTTTTKATTATTTTTKATTTATTAKATTTTAKATTPVATTTMKATTAGTTTAAMTFTQFATIFINQVVAANSNFGPATQCYEMCGVENLPFLMPIVQSTASTGWTSATTTAVISAILANPTSCTDGPLFVSCALKSCVSLDTAIVSPSGFTPYINQLCPSG